MPFHFVPRGAQHGFTLIELIVVMILLGILSVTASSRLISRSSFDAIVVRDQAIALARQIQREGMDVVLTPDAVPDHLGLLIGEKVFGTPSCRTRTDTTSCLSTTHDKVSFSFSPSHRMLSEDVMTLHFDWLGRPMMVATKPFQRACTPNRCEITITARNGETAMLCINAEGLINDCAI